ncbi:unnamed protein product [Fusarium equiseti]|uniref:Amine oxidase domain-containing protein n=1 Tax=Fusarium equiseti TaxID=61235 RepID=A0A8J2JBK2_FUSEQ|nr:unnamed protein product [Fusarium equiseti]
MKLYFLITAVASLATAVATPKSKSTVCIVGAGVSGLTAAKALEDKGYKTVIFEKKDTVGGKCQSHYEDGQYFPLGAVLFTRTPSYGQTYAIVKSSGVAFDEFDPAFGFEYNPKTGAAALMQPPSPATAQALQEELARYATVWQKKFAPYAVPGYKLYYLQFYAPDIVGSFAGVFELYKTDFYKVLKKVARNLKGPVHLNARIEHIERKSKPSIQYRTVGGKHTKTQLCSDVILAFPPTSEALKESGLSLSGAEKTLFSQVDVNGYFSSAVRMSHLGHNLSVSQELPNPLVPFKPEGQPVYLTPFHANSDIVSVYSVDDPTLPSATRVKKHLVQDLSKINRDLGKVNAKIVALDAADIRAFSGKIPYFPHVSPESLADGWYKKFISLQGKEHTYFTSGLNSFENVENTIRAARDLVKTHF